MLAEQHSSEERYDEAADYGLDFVARGDSPLDEDEQRALSSQLPGVSDERWTQFVERMMTSKFDAVSDSNAVGAFEMMPRRLADLGLVERLARSKSPAGRIVYVAEFVPPMTSDRFLRSPEAQYDAFCASMRDYDARMSSGEIARDPSMSRSGALALLHRCGPKGLETWRAGERFDNTKKIYENTAGIF